MNQGETEWPELETVGKLLHLGSVRLACVQFGQIATLCRSAGAGIFVFEESGAASYQQAQALWMVTALQRSRPDHGGMEGQ